MSLIKKIFSIMCVLSMMCGAVRIAAAAEDFPFKDVKEESWYYYYVKEVYENEYMIGTSGGSFEPETGVTRAMFITTLGRIHGACGIASNFADVEEGSWYADYVGWAENYRITDGYPDGTFRPNALITRQEIAVMIDRYLKYAWVTPKKGGESKFGDDEDIASWAEDAVYYLSGCNIIKGNPGGLFKPKNNTTRAETAALLTRICAVCESAAAMPSIAGESLYLYSIYSETASAETLDRTKDALAEKTDVFLSVNDEKTAHSIVLGCDETLRMREYHVYEKDKCLYIDVSTPYAADYFDEITADIFGSRRRAAVPAGFDGYGTYSIDSVYSFIESEENTASVFEIAVESDKGAVFYGIDEKITARASLLADGRLISVPNFKWKCVGEDGSLQEGTVSGEGGQCVFEIEAMPKPGFMKLEIKAANENGIPIAKADSKISFSGGFGVDILNLDVYEQKPEDFDEFWDNQLEILDAIAPAVIEKNDYSTDTHYVYDIKAACVDEAPASFFITIPKSAQASSLPINVFVDSYGVNPAEPAYYDNAIGLNICPHSMDNVNTDEYFNEKRKELDKFDFIGTENRESYYFKGMLLRAVQAVRYAESLPEWNGSDVNISGGSMGAYQAIAVAALEDSVTSVKSTFPGRSDMAGMQLTSRFDSGEWPDWCEAVSYYDGAYFAQRVKCKVDVTVGLGDTSCPAGGAACMYNELDCDKTITYLQNTGHDGKRPEHGEVFIIEGNEIKDVLAHEIIDRGTAGPVKRAEADRTLSEAEEKLKAATQTKDGKMFIATYAGSDSLTEKSLEESFISRFINKGVLEPGCTVEFDFDSLFYLKESYSDIGSGETVTCTVYYTLREPNGGYYTSSAQFIINKRISD